MMTNLKKQLLNWGMLLTAIVFVTFIFYVFNKNDSDGLPIVAITQIVEHPALDQERAAIIQTLHEAGFIDGKTVKIIFQSAQGNIATAAQIGQRFAGLNPSVVVAISTPSAQAVLSAVQNKDIPLVFSAVSDPLSAHLCKSMQQPLQGVTGVTDFLAAKPQLDLVRSFMPSGSRIGVLYNSGEINSVSLVKELSALSAQHGIILIPVTVNKSSEIGSVTSSLIGKVDAIYIPNDNTVVSAIDTVVKIATENRIPVFSGDPLLIDRGIIAAVGFDRTMLGNEAGKRVVQILQGQTAETIAIGQDNKIEWKINRNLAKSIGLTLPSNLPIELAQGESQ